MRGLARRRCREGLVLRDGDARDLAAVHALERDQMTGFVNDGDTHGHANFGGFCRGAGDELPRIRGVEALYRQHGWARR